MTTTIALGPLTGIRVIDLSQATLGPAATATPGAWRFVPPSPEARRQTVLADFGTDSDRASRLRANGVIS